MSDAEGGAEGAIGCVESLEQRQEVALAQVDFGQSRGATVAGQVCDQRVDDLLLTGAKSQRLAQPLLLEQQIDGQIALIFRGQAADPLQDLIECRQRIVELAERAGALSRPAAEVNCGRPVFRAPEVMASSAAPSSIRFACVNASA